MEIYTPTLQAGIKIPLLPIHNNEGFPYLSGGEDASKSLLYFPVGTGLFLPRDVDEPVFRIAGHVWLPACRHMAMSRAVDCPLLYVLRDITESYLDLRVYKEGYSLAVITLSDKGAAGLRDDISGPTIMEMIRTVLPLCFSQLFLLPDDASSLKALLADLALAQKYDLICTTGGTGVSPRDITPQVTTSLLDIQLPGFIQAMMQSSLEKTPNAVISRATAGIIGNTLVINLPGSPRAASENLSVILPALEHTLKKLHGDPTDCGA